MDQYRPSWLPLFVERNLVEDEAGLLQYGDYELEDYYRLNFNTPLPSWMDHWPTEENPDNLYKFAAVWIEVSQDEFMTERDTYSLLEWLGDVGGLFDMLKLIGSWLVVPFASFRLSS